MIPKATRCRVCSSGWYLEHMGDTCNLIAFVSVLYQALRCADMDSVFHHKWRKLAMGQPVLEPLKLFAHLVDVLLVSSAKFVEQVSKSRFGLARANRRLPVLQAPGSGQHRRAVLDFFVFDGFHGSLPQK